MNRASRSKAKPISLENVASDGRFRTPTSKENGVIDKISGDDEGETKEEGSQLGEMKAKFSRVKKLIKKGLVDEVEITLKDLSRSEIVQGSEKKKRKLLKSLKKKLTQGCLNSDKIEKYYKRICKRWDMEEFLEDDQRKSTTKAAAKQTPHDDPLMDDPFEADTFVDPSPLPEKSKSVQKEKAQSSKRRSRRQARRSRSPKSAPKKGSRWTISSSSLSTMSIGPQQREAFEQSCRLLELNIKRSQLVWVKLNVFKDYNKNYAWPAVELTSVDGLNNKELKYVFDKKNPLWPTPSNQRLVALLFWNFQSETKNIQSVPASEVVTFCRNDKWYKKYIAQTNNTAKFWLKKMKHKTYKAWFQEAVRSLNAKTRRIVKAQEELDKKAGPSVAPQAVPDVSSEEESSSEDEGPQQKIIETFEDRVLTAGDIVKYIDRTQPAYSRIQTTKVIEVRTATHPHPIRLASNFPLDQNTSICRKINHTQFGHWRPIVQFKLVKGKVDEDDDSLAIAKKFSEKLSELRNSHKSFSSMIHFKSFDNSKSTEKRKLSPSKLSSAAVRPKKLKSCQDRSKSKDGKHETIVLSDGDSQGLSTSRFGLEKRTSKTDNREYSSDDFEEVEKKGKEFSLGSSKQSDTSFDSSDSHGSSPIIEIEDIETDELGSSSTKRKRTYPMRKEDLPVLGRLKVHPDSETTG